MKKPVTIVVLTKFKEVFQPFFESYLKFTKDTSLLIVRDGEDVPHPKNVDLQLNREVSMVQGPETFSMAGNGNIGLKAVTDGDILYCGDDIRFLQPNTIEKLQEIAYDYPDVGILSPRIVGRGSPTQVNPQSRVNEVRPLEMWFPCIYIKREVIEKVGYLDEDFNEFGSDDLDYCIRVKMAGYKLAVTNVVAVQHGASVEGGPTTFCKKLGVEEWQKQQSNSFEKLRKKWGVSPAIFDRFLMTGDVKLLEEKKDTSLPLATFGPESDPEEVKAFLRSRYIHVATPAYGGMLTVNYVNSLNALIELCINIGVKYTIEFIWNDSLVTRARNKMVDKFMKNGLGATDFYFIDADIGFDPRDIISLLLHDADVIGCPCVRKNLRLDRVVEAVKKNHRDYTIPELEVLLGEFVVNFPEGKMPSTINLGALLEVQDVGTGIMKVKRETFEKVTKAFPDRWYMPMGQETEKREPMFLFYQAEFDEDTREFNNGYPDYVSEDYSFCRLVRKAGMRVYLAPWVKSSHMGSYLFRGDMLAVANVGGGMR